MNMRTIGLLSVALVSYAATAAERVVGVSPWGPDDEIGRLNLMTDDSRRAILSRVTGGRMYDLSVEYYIGMPSWQAAGAEKIPPIVARGVLIDVAAAQGSVMLPPGYRLTRDDLVEALERQNVELQQGDVALIRTGRMALYGDTAAYMDNPPGMGLEAARYLVEERGAMIVGADNLSFEAFPSELATDYVPVHTYLLAQQGAPIIELAYLEELSRDGVYQFAFIGGPLKLRGSDAAPLRPVALPIR